MYQAIIADCLPWIALLVIAVIVARLLVWFSGARLNLRKLAAVHRCQEGSVQSLSFVLTLPLFVMVMMFIVQVSQITMGTILVNYAAFASARSAIVWIPAYVSQEEPENCISSFSFVESFDEETTRHRRFEVSPSGPKYERIKQAAVLACLPLAPSRDLGYDAQGTDAETAAALTTLYAGMDSDATSNTRIPIRISNKLGFARTNTDVKIEFTHDNGLFDTEPSLNLEHGGSYDIVPWRAEYRRNELGWRDPVTVTVTHNMALLPGPGRLLAGSTGDNDSISERVDRSGEVYTWPITASATLGNEGEKSLKPYVQTGRFFQ